MVFSLGSYRWTVALVVVASLVVAACAPSGAPAAQPTTASAPAATQVAAAPAKQPTAPAAVGAQPAGKASIQLSAGVSNPKGDIFSDAMDKFAELVAAKTNGEVSVSVSYAGALGADQQLIQSAGTGSIDLGVAASGNAARFSDAYYVLDLPFLFKSTQALIDTMNGPIGKDMNAVFEKDAGVKILSIWSYGIGRDIQTRNKELKVPADIKGVKIRTVSTPIELSIFKAWGANPTPVDWGQTYTAVQQGVVDGSEIMLPQVLANKFYEIEKYNLSLHYGEAAELFYMNAKKFASLSATNQQAIVDAAQEAAQFNYKETADLAKSAEQELTSKDGMTFYDPTPEEYAQWASVREQVWQDVANQEKGKIDMDLANKIYTSQK